MTADEDERVQQLLNELRNTLLGVQVLLAGMIGVAFTSTFADLPQVDRNAYGLAVIAAAGASCFLITPTQYHRIARHHEASGGTLRVGRVCGTAGSALLGVAVSAVVFAVTDVVFGRVVGVVATAAVAVAVAGLWFALPLTARR